MAQTFSLWQVEQAEVSGTGTHVVYVVFQRKIFIKQDTQQLEVLGQPLFLNIDRHHQNPKILHGRPGQYSRRPMPGDDPFGNVRRSACSRHKNVVPDSTFLSSSLPLLPPLPPGLPISQLQGIVNQEINIYTVRPTRMRSSIPLLEPGPPRFFLRFKTANKPHASRNYTQDH